MFYVSLGALLPGGGLVWSGGCGVGRLSDPGSRDDRFLGWVEFLTIKLFFLKCLFDIF